MCGKKRHTKTEIRSEMSDLICGRIAAGENYNLTRDSECGNVIDRDYQAALNLKRYGEMVLEQSVL